MSETPDVLTQVELTQRESQTVCMIQSEEILRVRTPAYSRTKSDLSFLVRQPSASAICVNDVQLVLECQFVTDTNVRALAKYQHGVAASANNKYQPLNLGLSDYGFVPQMLPIQNKCIRNAVITINGASQSHRSNEFGVEWCLLHGSRKYMNKIGGGVNEFSKPVVYEVTNANTYNLYAENKTACMQHDRWLAQMGQDKTIDDYSGTTTPKFQFCEKLYLGPFGAFNEAESFPSWSVEGSKSSGLLHVHNMQLSFAMEDKWWNSMFLTSSNYAANNNFAKITDVIITKAEIHTRWVLPPPRMLSAAISQSVSYSTFDVLRFVADPQSGTGQMGGGLQEDGGRPQDAFSYKLNACSFPYMPQIFVFSVCPHYGHCTDVIGSRKSKGGALEQMKLDKRVTITHIELQINTSSMGIPFSGEGGAQAARINARDLYRMTLENAASFENFPHDFEDWYRNCCVVAITPGQLSGVLNSPNIRGSVTIQGTVHCKNLTGHPINTGSSNIPYAGAGVVTTDNTTFPDQAIIPRYQCLVSGYYCNRSLILDAKSGLLQETTFGSSFQAGLRSGTIGS